MTENKLVVVRDKKSGDLTFPGGGCRYGSNTRECAVKELEKQSRRMLGTSDFSLCLRVNFVQKMKRLVIKKKV